MGKSITTIARPRDLELAVPPIGLTGSGMTLRQVAKGFSDWVASELEACLQRRVSLRPEWPAGQPHQSRGGKVWSRGDMRWPVFLVTGDKAEIIDSADRRPKSRQRSLRLAQGPWLVRNETVCNISDESTAWRVYGPHGQDLTKRACCNRHQARRYGGTLCDYGSDSSSVSRKNEGPWLCRCNQRRWWRQRWSPGRGKPFRLLRSSCFAVR
jgi:hypothetical protein